MERIKISQLTDFSESDELALPGPIDCHGVVLG